MKNAKLTLGLMLTFVLVIIAACTKEQMKQAGNEAANGLTVRMTDNPGDYIGLNMQIVKVDAYLEGSGWVNLSNETQMVDIATLTNGNSKVIATKSNIQAGHYTNLKITFGTQNTITVLADAGDSSNLRVAHQTAITYEGQREIIVETDINVDAKAGAELLVDFDVAKSVIAGIKGYVVKPVIVWVKDQKTAVKGELEGGVTAVLVLSDGKDSFSVFTDIKGGFYFKGIKPGVYKLVIYPARKMVNPFLHPRKIEGVVVVDGKVVYLGKIKI